MMRVKGLVFLIFLLLTLSSCAPVRSGNSYSVQTVPSSALAGISWDAAERVGKIFPPGHTTLHLTYPVAVKAKGQAPVTDIFGELFENNLRSMGFKVAPDSDGVEVTWAVDALGAEVKSSSSSWYLKLTLADSKGTQVLSRVYDGQGTPQGSFAVGLY